MRLNNSPLEHLAAFAIVFAAGLFSATSLAAYIARVRRISIRDHYKRIEREPDLYFHPPTKRSTIG